MNWFQRYGIPGAYFYGLLFYIYYILYPCNINQLNHDLLGPFCLLTFLPIGYLFSILQQYIYYSNNFFGIHRKAAIKSKVKFQLFESYNNDESSTEVCAILYLTGVVGPLKDKKEFIQNMIVRQEWCRRRMDVMSINLSLFLSSLLSLGLLLLLIILSKIFYWSTQIHPLNLIVFIVIVVAIMLLLILSYRKLEKQVIDVISTSFQKLI